MEMCMKSKPPKYPRDIQKTCLCCGEKVVVRFYTHRESVINFYCSLQCREAHWGKHAKTRAKITGKPVAKPSTVAEEKAAARRKKGALDAKIRIRDAEYWRCYRVALGLPPDMHF